MNLIHHIQNLKKRVPVAGQDFLGILLKFLWREMTCNRKAKSEAHIHSHQHR